MDSSHRWRRALLWAACCTWIVCAGIRWFSAAPLGHDEARYALAGRDLLHGDDSRWSYVPPAMEIEAVPGLWLGGTERALRLLPVLISLGLLGAVAGIARKLDGAEAAALAVAGLTCSGPLLRVSSDLLSDVPSAALLLAGVYLLFSELDAGPTRRILWVAPCFAAAIYFRFGSCLAIAIAGALAVLGYPKVVVRRVGLVAAVAGLFLLLLLPHFVHATQSTGSPLGTLRLSATVPRGFGKGIWSYLGHPLQLLGLPAVVLFPFACSAARRSRLELLLFLVALADILVLGIETFAQARYVLLATSLLVILGARELGRLLAASKRPVVVAALLAFAIGLGLQVIAAARYRSVRETGMQATLLASTALRQDAHGRPCYVLGRHQTQLEWYGGCTAMLVFHEPWPRPEIVYAVRDTTGGPDQPPLEALPGHHTSILYVDHVVDVIRLDAK